MSLRTPTEDDYKRLKKSCEDNNAENVRALCREAAMDMNREFGDLGGTVLLIAAMNGYTEMVLALMQEGADLEATLRDLKTPLLFAALYGHASVVQVLLDAGVNVDAVNMYGWTPLHNAIYNGHEPVVQLLLDAGANVYALNQEGRSPLDLCNSANYPKLAAMLRARRA